MRYYKRGALADNSTYQQDSLQTETFPNLYNNTSDPSKTTKQP